MWTLLAALASALVSAGIAVYQGHQQKKQNEALTGSQQEQNAWNAEQAEISRDFNAAEAEKSRNFTEFMARNKYSMETESMQAAGVNPAMVYGGGNLVPTAANGAQASSSAAAGQGSGNAGITNLLSLIEPAMAMARMPLEMKKLEQDIKESESREKKNSAETRGQEIQNEISTATKDEIIDFTKLSNDEKRATIDNILAKTDSELLGQQLTGFKILQEKLSYEQNQRMNDLVYQYQQMENAMKATEQDYQVRKYEAELNKIAAEINELYSQAAKNMSDVERNEVENAFTRQKTETEKKTTELEGQKLETEKYNTEKTKYEAARTYYDPKAHLTRAVVRPMDNLHDFLKGALPQKFGKNGDNAWNRSVERSSKRAREYQKQENARKLVEMYATAGQALEEYGEN